MPMNAGERVPRGLYRVCWSSVVGHGAGRGRPLPKDVADFVAHDESLAHPLRRYWVEECCDTPVAAAE